MTAPYVLRRRQNQYGADGYDPTQDTNAPGGGYASTSNAPHIGPEWAAQPDGGMMAQHFGTQSRNTRGYVGQNPNAPGTTAPQGRSGTGQTLNNPHGQGYGYTPPGGWVDDQGNTKQFQTGSYDPSNPNRQYNADGSFDIGEHNGENNANAWQGEYNSQMDARDRATQRGSSATTAKDAAAAAAGRMPGSYQAPSAWQAPGSMPAPYQGAGYTAPAAWQDPTQGRMPGPYAGNGTRNGITSTADIAGDTSTLAAALHSAGGGAPVTADAVGGGGAAFQNYARGASNSMLDSLKQQLARQQDTAAGRGRVGSGFQNMDTGTLARGLASDSENNLLSGALQAASMDQQAATGNADRRLAAGEFNAGQGQTAALAGLSTAASTGMNRSALDQSDFSTDQSFGLARQGQNYGQSADARNFSSSRYDDDRNFGSDRQATDFQQGLTSQDQGYRQASDARNFSRSSYDDDRNFGSQQQQTDYGQAADQRDYAAGNYRYEDTNATDADRYANSRLDNNYGITQNYLQQQQANKGPGIGGILGGVAGTLLGSALGPIGAGIGNKIGSSLFGGSQGGGGGYAAPQALPGYMPYQGDGSDDEEDPYNQYAGTGYPTSYNGWQR